MKPFMSELKVIALSAIAATGLMVLVAAAHQANQPPADDDKARVDFVVINGAIPCVIASKAGTPTAVSCKWDHIVFQDDEEDETPKAEWRM